MLFRIIALSLLFTFSVNEMSAQTESNAPIDPETSPAENNDPLPNPDLGAEFEFMEPEALVQDGAYSKHIYKERIALKLPDIREADVLWSKRIWREIYTQEKMNRPFNNEKQPFINVLLDIVQKEDDVKLYQTDAFTEEVEKNQLWSKLSAIDSVEVWNYELEDYELQLVKNDIDFKDFNRYRIKEDWVFDSRVSQMVCRIVGIAPVRDVVDPNTGFIRGQEVLFWLHFPQLRDHMAGYEAINPANDAITLSWTDVWDMRLFSSVITKESNNNDRRISDYKTGTDALMEAQEIREDMINFELDLWEQ